MCAMLTCETHVRTLEEIHADGSFVPYSVPQHSPARKVATLSLPHATDR
jgi:hypothetical protein